MGVAVPPCSKHSPSGITLWGLAPMAAAQASPAPGSEGAMPRQGGDILHRESHRLPGAGP